MLFRHRERCDRLANNPANQVSGYPYLFRDPDVGRIEFLHSHRSWQDHLITNFSIHGQHELTYKLQFWVGNSLDLNLARSHDTKVSQDVADALRDSYGEWKMGRRLLQEGSI